MKKIKFKIIGVSFLLILFLQAPAVHAIYSPTLSTEVVIIKQHVLTSIQQNGVGSLRNAWDKVFNQNEALKADGQAFGTPGGFVIIIDSLKEIFINQLVNNFMDGFSMLIGSFFETGQTITTCLRDDFWEIQALQEEVINETLKAALLNDKLNSAILFADYKKLDRYLYGGGTIKVNVDGSIKPEEFGGLKHDWKNTKVLFPGGELPNFYISCPYGEFDQAFKQLGNSFDNLADSFNKDLFSEFGTLKVAAQKRAKARAAQWIAANQITFTFAGENGHSPTSLVKGPGLDGLAGRLRTEAEFIKGYSELIYDDTLKPLFTTATAPITTLRDYYFRADEARRDIKLQLETASQFNLSLNSVSEESLKAFETTMFKINQTIQAAYTTSDDLNKICEQIEYLAKIQCKNKSGNLDISCKK